MNHSEYPKMHVSLNVNDIEKTKSFYNVFFSQNPTKEKKDYLKYVLNEPPLVISFIQNEKQMAPQVGHFGFQVESVEKLNEKLNTLSDKLPIAKVEQEAYCCYAMQDKFWVTDPSGYQWEIYYFHKDAVAMNGDHVEDQDAICCAPINEIQNEKAECCAPSSNCC